MNCRDTEQFAIFFLKTRSKIHLEWHYVFYYINYSYSSYSWFGMFCRIIEITVKISLMLQLYYGISCLLLPTIMNYSP